MPSCTVFLLGWMFHITGLAGRAWGFFWALPAHLFLVGLFFIYHLSSTLWIFSIHFFLSNTLIDMAMLICLNVYTFLSFFYLYCSISLCSRSYLQICLGFCNHLTVMDISTSISIQKCSRFEARYPISASWSSRLFLLCKCYPLILYPPSSTILLLTSCRTPSLCWAQVFV